MSMSDSLSCDPLQTKINVYMIKSVHKLYALHVCNLLSPLQVRFACAYMCVVLCTLAYIRIISQT